MADFPSTAPPTSPPYRVGREGFAQNLWRLTEAYPELSEDQIYVTLWEAIFAGEIYCIIPALKDYFSAWYHVPPELSLNLGDIVVVGPGLANLDTHEWLFNFEGALLDFVLVWSDIGRVFQDREHGVREQGTRITNNFSPQQTIGRQHGGTITQNINYFGVTPPVAQPPSAPEPVPPLPDPVPEETSTSSAPTGDPALPVPQPAKANRRKSVRPTAAVKAAVMDYLTQNPKHGYGKVLRHIIDSDLPGPTRAPLRRLIGDTKNSLKSGRR
jgi:hypothetical protein